jgi:E3 ubiquitin-protein ligase ZSWIM2
VDAHIREVLASTYFILNENGPLCFTIGGSDQSDEKHRVSIGDRHTCTCAAGRAGREPCEHMLFVLLKVFRVPPANPLLHSLGIREAQLDEVMKGRARRRRLARPVGSAPEGASIAPPTGGADGAAQLPPQTVSRRMPTDDDTCPICMEGLDAGGSLVWCREGCGNNVHRHCMLVWARHRGGNHSSAELTCPMCRAAWGEIGAPERDERPRQTAAQRRDARLRELADADVATHHGVSCASCKTGALLGTRFRCIICDGYNLCTLCYATPGTHAQHTFECIRRPGQEWEVADREAVVDAVRERIVAVDGALPVALADGGEGSAEAQLARLARVQMPMEALAGAPASDDSEPAVAAAHCAHCRRVARKQQWFKALGCGHHVHEACLPEWLRAHHGHCPTCAVLAVSSGALAAQLPSARAEPLAASTSAPATPGGGRHAPAHGCALHHHASGPLLAAGPIGMRRRASSSAGPRIAGGGAAVGGRLSLGVTGCACCGAAAPTTAGLAGRGFGPCATPVGLAVGGTSAARSGRPPARQSTGGAQLMRGRLARGATTLSLGSAALPGRGPTGDYV